MNNIIINIIKTGIVTICHRKNQIFLSISMCSPVGKYKNIGGGYPPMDLLPLRYTPPISTMLSSLVSPQDMHISPPPESLIFSRSPPLPFTTPGPLRPRPGSAHIPWRTNARKRGTNAPPSSFSDVKSRDAHRCFWPRDRPLLKGFPCPRERSPARIVPYSPIVFQGTGCVT